ncbi:MAG: septum formation protein Maf [candidate division Zixibacteria bacterium RBG_16_40_9]|nr:MAG: septum formation protein Maf [candidate division Zixibacteria bacterium RBG_16_40_9]
MSRFLNGYELILASNSPRRAEILNLAKVPFQIKTPDYREEVLNSEKPEILVQKNSLKKAESISAEIQSGIILGADTVVVLEQEILGKPKDEEEAFLMLKKLNGKWHQVYTGVALLNKNNSRQITGYEVTKVKFNSLTESQIQEYIATGDPLDKAGAYGIQESAAGGLVEKIEGNFDNVMGLPLHTVKKLLSQI